MTKISLKCLPISSLPYENDAQATKMMVKFFEKTPFLALLPKISQDENILSRTLENLPSINLEAGKISIDYKAKSFEKDVAELDSVFSNPTSKNLDKYKFESAFLTKFLQILERVKPENAIVNFFGPFSLSQKLVNEDGLNSLADKNCRKLIIQLLSARALWIINKIHEVSPETAPVIIFEDHELSSLGDVKRKNEDVTTEIVINMYSKIVQKIKEYGGLVGVQCFKKCDWQIPIDAGVDIISFDAYNNPNNLSIIPEKMNDFFASGGHVNWGIVPASSENIVKSLNVEDLYRRFVNTMEDFVSSGVSRKLAYKNSMVSIQCDINSLPLMFAERAIILSTQLGKKIHFKN